MFRNYRAVLLCLMASMGIAAQAMPKRKNQVEEYKKLGFSLALIRTLDKGQEKKAMRKKPRHAKYIDNQSKKKDAFLAGLVNGQIKRLETQKALEDKCRQNMFAEFRRLDDAREAAQAQAQEDVAGEIESQIAAGLGQEIDADAWLEKQHDIHDNGQEEIWV